MKNLIKIFENKLYHQHLSRKENTLFGALDVDVVWNKNHPSKKKLSSIIKKLDIGALIFAKPESPYAEIIDYLGINSKDGFLYPNDNETRTFIHSFAVLKNFNYQKIEKLLKKHKIIIIPGHGIITIGDITPEQAFVYFSSACFSCFIKFFTDYYYDMRRNTLKDNQRLVFKKTIKHIHDSSPQTPHFKSTVLKSEKGIKNSMTKTGKLTVDYGLVDSYFGNISYCNNQSIFISQTGSPLDSLEDSIDIIHLNRSSGSITASSEFTAHKQIYEKTEFQSILHAHPKFSVIISMLCDNIRCKNRNECYIKCSKKRYFQEIPIVTGEIGQGKYGLCHTVPNAMKNCGAVIVYGHGVFTAGKKNFKEAFLRLFDIENRAKQHYTQLTS